MQFRSSLLGTAMVLAVSVGSAHAADQFTTLAGVPAQSLTAAQMEQVQGTWFLNNSNAGDGTKLTSNFSPAKEVGSDGTTDNHGKTGAEMLISSDTSTISN